MKLTLFEGELCNLFVITEAYKNWKVYNQLFEIFEENCKKDPIEDILITLGAKKEKTMRIEIDI